MGRVDLHIHSNVSDGRLSPAEIVLKAAEIGLKVIAITDHDAVGGIPQATNAAEAFPGLKLIPGVEVSTDVPHGEVHVLGYFINYEDADFLATLERNRNSRVVRAQKMITKLRDLGMPVDWERVKQIAGEGSLGRPHIAQAMVEKGYVPAIRDAFARYIGREGPAYVEREKMAPQEVVEVILKARGLPVLGHPLTTPDHETIVKQLSTSGLVGLEAYCNGYTPEETSGLISLARAHGLIVTGGSDFHGLGTGNEAMMGGVDVPLESAEQLIALAGKRGCESVLKRGHGY